MPKLSDLTEMVSAQVADDDLIPIVDVSAGTSGTKTLPIAELASRITPAAGVGTSTNGQVLTNSAGAVAGRAAPSGALVGTTDTQTLTNKTVSGADNTVSNLPASALTSGTVATARLGSGTASSTTFLRGDQTWGAAPGDVVGQAVSVDSEVALFSSTSGKLIKRANVTGLAKLTSGVLSAATSGTDYETAGTSATHAAVTATHGATGAVVGTTNTQTLTNKTLTTPTIGSFTNATHTHTNAAGGGTLAEAALALTDVTTANATTSAHGFLKKLSNSSTQFMNGVGSWAVPAGAGGGGDTSSHIYVKNDFGALGDGTTDDTTAINNAIAAVNADRGQELIFEPGVYLVPDGITETKTGLVVRGIGARAQGPGESGFVGVVLKATTAGAWVWTHDSASGNDYRGGRFENLTFKGDADTAGGFRLRSNYAIVMNCASCANTTGVGFLAQMPPTGDDASWNIVMNCLSQDDLIGFQCNTPADLIAHPGGGGSTEYHNCIASKSSAGGIVNTGVGIRMYDNNAYIQGGKMENNDIGIEVLTLASGGTAIIGTRCEGNATWDIALNRTSGTNGTRNLVVGRFTNLLVGAFQVNDTIINTGGPGGTMTDNGTDTIIIGNAILKTTRTSGTPTGGYSGEIRVGSGKIWVNDAGTWKSATVT